MNSIEAQNLSHSYEYPGSSNRSIENICLDIKQGELVAILGQNGCGKTSLVKHFNALLELQEGALRVAGFNAADGGSVWEMRRACGMVFQNPDNQFVSSIVEEDISFGLENYDVPEQDVPLKVKNALALVGMEGFEKKSPHMLSGGQKQRIAIAGVLALEPDILIFDEATSMLDPPGRDEVLAIIRRLHEQEHKTIIMITHFIEEIVFADRIILLHKGRLICQGSPREILTDPELLARVGLRPPLAVRAYFDLKEAGVELPFCPLTNEELVDELCRLY